jgi:hypothetical protein
MNALRPEWPPRVILLPGEVVLVGQRYHQIVTGFTLETSPDMAAAGEVFGY